MIHTTCTVGGSAKQCNLLAPFTLGAVFTRELLGHMVSVLQMAHLIVEAMVKIHCEFKLSIESKCYTIFG